MSRTVSFDIISLSENEIESVFDSSINTIEKKKEALFADFRRYEELKDENFTIENEIKERTADMGVLEELKNVSNEIIELLKKETSILSDGGKGIISKTLWIGAN